MYKIFFPLFGLKNLLSLCFASIERAGFTNNLEFLWSRALSYISILAGKEQPNIKPAMNVFIIKLLLTYEALSDPSSYRIDHAHIIQICTTPFR